MNDDNTTGGFAALGLRTELLGALDDLGYEEPTPIQRESIPPLIEGRDLLYRHASTNTGSAALADVINLSHRGTSSERRAVAIAPLGKEIVPADGPQDRFGVRR